MEGLEAREGDDCDSDADQHDAHTHHRTDQLWRARARREVGAGRQAERTSRWRDTKSEISSVSRWSSDWLTCSSQCVLCSRSSSGRARARETTSEGGAPPPPSNFAKSGASPSRQADSDAPRSLADAPTWLTRAGRLSLQPGASPLPRSLVVVALLDELAASGQESCVSWLLDLRERERHGGTRDARRLDEPARLGLAAPGTDRRVLVVLVVLLVEVHRPGVAAVSCCRLGRLALAPALLGLGLLVLRARGREGGSARVDEEEARKGNERGGAPSSPASS